MVTVQNRENFIPTRHVALSVIDGAVRAKRTVGDFPPPLGEITCDIVEVIAPVQRVIDPPLALWTFRNPSGYMLLDGTYSGPLDRSRRWPLGPGRYRVRVRGTYYQDGEFILQWPLPPGETRVRIAVPNNPDNLELLPGASYPFPDVTTGLRQLGPTILRGSAFRSDGMPFVGVIAEVINLPILQPANFPPLGDWPFTRARTDVRGDWALMLPGRVYIDNAPENLPMNTPPLRRQISIRIQYPTGPVVVIEDVLLGSEHSVRNTALRGQVLGRGGVPIAGAQIATSIDAAVSTSRGDGTWLLYFDLNQVAVPNATVTVTTPDGSVASNTAVALQQGATVIVPAFHFF